ncbi:MAG: hypothetical protein K5745_02060 [Saccharofermentans sp.]|nr:hypothetical protein [Saccharofermentans sp.]
MFGLTLYQVLWYFLEYAFIGWIIEVLYHAVCKGQIVNRGFLNGPICPVYGVGMVGVIAITNMINSELDKRGIDSNSLRLLFIFLGGTVFATVIELIAGWALDKLFHARWWDYTSLPFNVGGYICLEFSILWGLGILFVVQIVHPLLAIEPTHGLIQRTAGIVLLVIFYIFFIADLTATVFTMIGINKKLAKINEISEAIHEGSDFLTDKVGGNAYKATVKLQEGAVQASLAKAEMRDMTEDRIKELKETRTRLIEELTRHRHIGAGRLIMAFPEAKHTRYQDAFKAFMDRARTKRSKKV